MMEMAREEREDLADLLAQLTPQQWEQPSLCERWRVRDVVAHLIGYDELGRRALMRQFVKGRFRFNRINQVGVDELRTRSTEELRRIVAEHLQPRGLTAGFGGMIALVDGMIHQQDIRRALGIQRTILPDRLLAVLGCARYVPAVRGAWRARGVRLVATDVDWSYGTGPEVRGPGEALLMAMSGRPDALQDLAGEGKAKLARNIHA